jgi:hypothetical protein
MKVLKTRDIFYCVQTITENVAPIEWELATMEQRQAVSALKVERGARRT